VSRELLDEHVGRLFERILHERGHEVEQASDGFGEVTTDPVVEAAPSTPQLGADALRSHGFEEA